MRARLIQLGWCLSAAVLGATEPARLTPAQRLEPARLQAVEADRARFARERVALLDLWSKEDYRAVLHVHAEDSDHTLGTREQVLVAARKTGVRVVMFTDHGGPLTNTWRGRREGVLFIAGSEESEGQLRFPPLTTAAGAVRDAELKFACHVEDHPDADLKGCVGMEICNRHTDQKLDRTMSEIVSRAAGDAELWKSLTNSFARWPDAVFAAGSDPRPELFGRWDRELRKRRFTGIAGNDAHQNVIVKGFNFDPYEVSFRHLTTHLLAPELTEESIRMALRRGHGYVAHDWLADPTGFAFGAMNNLGVFPMGDKAPMQGTTTVMGLTPVASHQKLIFEGRVIAETNGTNLTFKAKQRGAYRLEAWLTVGGEERPWIYSNPVYLEDHGLFDIPLPNGLETPEVAVKKDIAYAQGRPEDEPKQKLDLYIPPTRASASVPVFVFMHGGAWRFGDRALYPPVGHRFAREGILTVIPSYRLAPKSPWPAQAEDTAAAFAWTVRHIAEHGGDTNRIFIGGHSAGGHLTSLLACNDRFLKPYGLSSSLIKGVVSLSGVYNLDVGDAMTSVFGRERGVRRDASPLFFVQAPAPPFFVSYCEWDYPTLPAQAKIFHAALRQAGIASELFFTPRDNHIYEMISLTQENDETAKAVIQFILGH